MTNTATTKPSVLNPGRCSVPNVSSDQLRYTPSKPLSFQPGDGTTRPSFGTRLSVKCVELSRFICSLNVCKTQTRRVFPTPICLTTANCEAGRPVRKRRAENETTYTTKQPYAQIYQEALHNRNAETT